MPHPDWAARRSATYRGHLGWRAISLLAGCSNSSLSGEQKQDNELTVRNNAVIAAETRAELDRNHDAMLKQMVAGRSKRG
jgi:hypothetical protein